MAPKHHPSFPIKAIYTPKGFLWHVASLGQAFAHCPRFSAAASRRSMVRVAVPLAGNTLSGPLPVIALVSRYLTNKLIGRAPLPFLILAENFVITTRVAITHRCLPYLSAGYHRDGGAFDTCYCPVRH